MKVGFVGLGIMGRPMAKNVVKAGYEVTVFDFNQEAIDDLVAHGAKAADSGKAAAQEADVVITMLPNSPNVEAALFAENGIAEGLRPGATVIDMSSIAPKASQAFAERLAKQEVTFLDAPVSGGEPKAIDGTIAVMLGGNQEVFNRYEELLNTMASTVTQKHTPWRKKQMSILKPSTKQSVAVWRVVLSWTKNPTKSSLVILNQASASSCTLKTCKTSWKLRKRSTLRHHLALWRWTSCNL